MPLTIKYFADIRALMGRDEQPWTAPATTLRALLAALCDGRGGAEMSRRLFRDGQLHPMITILVNGRNVVHLAGLETRLHDDDVVAIFPMVAGG